jgi:C4-type Zn-finger protein
MKHYRPIVTVAEPTTASGAQVIACPACNARLAFHRSRAPHIDECGFESYSLECKECGAPLAGIIDPFDETLLLTQIAA